MINSNKYDFLIYIWRLVTEVTNEHMAKYSGPNKKRKNPWRILTSKLSQQTNKQTNRNGYSIGNDVLFLYMVKKKKVKGTMVKKKKKS